MKMNHLIAFILGLMVFGALCGCTEQEMELREWCLYTGGEYNEQTLKCKCGDTPCAQGVVCLNGGTTCASTPAPATETTNATPSN